MNKFISAVIILFLTCCASQTAKMAHQINNNESNIYIHKESNSCKDLINKSDDEDFIFNSRLIATPIIGIIGLIAAPAIIAANASLDLKDRLTASELSKACGGKGLTTEKIATDVAINGSIGFILQGSNLSIYPGGEEVPISTAAEAASN